MTFIIDANNLAGKLGLLETADFDKILISEIEKNFAHKQIRIFLIFDSADPYGDKYNLNLLTVIHAPAMREFGGGADNKIIEVARQTKDEGFVISDDIDLKNKIDSLEIKKIKTVKTDYIINRMNRLKSDEDKIELDKNEADNIMKELLKKWK